MDVRVVLSMEDARDVEAALTAAREAIVALSAELVAWQRQCRDAEAERDGWRQKAFRQAQDAGQLERTVVFSMDEARSIEVALVTLRTENAALKAQLAAILADPEIRTRWEATEAQRAWEAQQEGNGTRTED